MNLQEADRHFIHTYNRSVIFEKGEGMYLFDNEGNKYLDMYNNVAGVGHCNPAVVMQLQNR